MRPGQAIDEAVSGFYAKVSTPVLTDISLETGDIRAEPALSYTAARPLRRLAAGRGRTLPRRRRGDHHPARNGQRRRSRHFVYEDQRFRDEGGEPFIPRLWATRAIGHMMQQIRLLGEDAELVQSIVNLSTRYGIITPYTSFLIEEDDILAQMNGSIVLEEAAEMLAAPTQVSGAQAVDRAAMELEMAAADAPLVQEVAVTRVVTETVVEGEESAFHSEPLVVNAGGKSFFQRQGILVDSTFDPDMGEPEVIPFASDAYFDLLNEHPAAGEYLALAEEILVVLGGQAYRITVNSEQSTVNSEQSTVNSEQSTVNSERPAGPASSANGQNSTPSEQTGQPAAGLPVCGAALAMPLLLIGGLGISGLRRRKM